MDKLLPSKFSDGRTVAEIEKIAQKHLAFLYPGVKENISWKLTYHIPRNGFENFFDMLLFHKTEVSFSSGEGQTSLTTVTPKWTFSCSRSGATTDKMEKVAVKFFEKLFPLDTALIARFQSDDSKESLCTLDILT